MILDALRYWFSSFRRARERDGYNERNRSALIPAHVSVARGAIYEIYKCRCCDSVSDAYLPSEIDTHAQDWLRLHYACDRLPYAVWRGANPDATTIDAIAR